MIEINPFEALKVSLIVATLAIMVSLPIAIYFAWILARKNFWGKTFVSMLIFFPLVTPPLVTGYIMLEFLGRNSWMGSILNHFGISIPFSLTGAVLASAVVGFPLLVMFIRSTFAAIDPKYEQYAMTAGHPPLQTFFKVVLPMSYPGILAGGIISFARALGEFGATIVLAGNKEGETRTISLAIYSLLDSPLGERPASFLIMLSLGLSFTALVLYEIFTKKFLKKIEWY
jgi:molybdate transport system permease protein